MAAASPVSPRGCSGAVVGTSLSRYLLEKSRVVFQVRGVLRADSIGHDSASAGAANIDTQTCGPYSVTWPAGNCGICHLPERPHVECDVSQFLIFLFWCRTFIAFTLNDLEARLSPIDQMAFQSSFAGM